MRLQLTKRSQEAITAAVKARWSDGDLQQIRQYAERLKDPQVAYHTSIGYSGYVTFAKYACWQHLDDCRLLMAWEAHMGPTQLEIYEQIVHRAAARIKAFHLAGLPPLAGFHGVQQTIKIYQCGCCDCYHPLDWDGDCRDDANRYGAPEEFAERNGIHVFTVEIVDQPE